MKSHNRKRGFEVVSHVKFMGDKRKVGFEKKIQFSNTELAMLRSFQPKTLKDPESIALILKNCEIRIGKFLNFPSELLSYLT